LLRLLGIMLSALWLAACSDDSAPSAVNASQTRDGAQLYRQYCVTCHGSGALGAPRVGKTLVQEAIAGINSMPPRGGCFDCSDAEIRNTVIYMLQLSGAK